MNSPSSDAVTLAERAYRIRRNALLMGEVQGQGYIGQALDIADVLAVAYFGAMRYRPENPDGRTRPLPPVERPLCDRALCRAVRSRLPAARKNSKPTAATTAACRCPAWRAYTPGMEMSGGSLGHGLTIAVGAASD